MQLSPESSTQGQTRYSTVSTLRPEEELAIRYLTDDNAEQKRLDRWLKLLPRIQQMREGGKEDERTLITEVRNGVSDSLRFQIWPMLTQKPLKTYQECQGRCEIKDIELDLERTFPNNNQYKGIEARMKVVLNALAFAIPSVGYCQGMNFIVGTLLLRVSNEEAYNMAYHIFHWEGHQQLLTNLELIHEKLYSLDRLTKKHYPQLWKHLHEYELDPILYASSWFITIFCNCLPTSYALRILECLLLQGQKVIYRVAMQILKMKKKALKKYHQVEKIVEELKNYDELIEPNIDAFFEGMYSIPLSRQQIKEYKAQYRRKNKKGPQL